jgi:hypothetical protein
MNPNLQTAYLKAKKAFAPLNGIIGVGYGPKFAKGKVVDDEAIIVLVEKKLPKEELISNQTIPDMFEGFPTDVREPKVTTSRNQEDISMNMVPTEEENCLTDYHWIDWGKIHQVNRQQKTENDRNMLMDQSGNLPTTHAEGNIFVIHDPGQTLVTTTSNGHHIMDFVGAYKIFRAEFGDHYDFATFYLDTSSGIPDMGNASSIIYNDISGINVDNRDDRSSWGSAKLSHINHHSWFTLRTLIHEPGHRWLSYVNYKNTDTGSRQPLMHADWAWNDAQKQFHWGRWIDDRNSCMDYDRADWSNNADNTFNRIVRDERSSVDEQYFSFWTLDQYLMGLIPAHDVSDLTIIQNPSPTIGNNFTGPYRANPNPIHIGIANIVYEEGERNPDYLHSQRIFHQAVILITTNQSTTSSFITASQNWCTRHTANFRRATDGRAMIDTSLLTRNYSDLYIKDNNDDNGTETSNNNDFFWLSPDIWIRNNDDNGTEHQNIISGQSNWIYARVRNKSSSPYNNVTVNFYIGNFLSRLPAIQFLYPVDWNPVGFLGHSTIDTVPSASNGKEGTSVAKIEWTADRIPPETGWHPFIACEIIPMEVEPSGLHRVYENKKLAQRNLSIIDMTNVDIKPEAIMFVHEFVVGHSTMQDKLTQLLLQAEGQIEGVHLFLFIGSAVEDLFDNALEIKVNIPISSEKIPSGKSGVQAIPSVGKLPIPSNSKFDETPLARKYNIIGLNPVKINGLPLLQVVEPRKAGLSLGYKSGNTQTLCLIGIVSPYDKNGKTSLYNLRESTIAGKSLGGITLQVNL